MPEPTTQPGDGGQGAGGAPAAGDPPKAPEAKKLDLTQEQLDAIIADRLKRAVPADYDEAKRKAALHDQAETDKLSEVEKANKAKTDAEAAAAVRAKKADERLKRAAIIEAASTAGAVDAEVIVALLASNADITVDEDGNVAGAKAAVKDLLKDKPFLVKGKTPGASGGEFGGSDPKDKAAKIADLEQKANDPKLTAQERGRFYAEARALKFS